MYKLKKLPVLKDKEGNIIVGRFVIENEKIFPLIVDLEKDTVKAIQGLEEKIKKEDYEKVEQEIYNIINNRIVDNSSQLNFFNFLDERIEYITPENYICPHDEFRGEINE